MLDGLAVKVRPYRLVFDYAFMDNDSGVVKYNARRIETDWDLTIAINKDVYLPVEAQSDVDRLLQKYVMEIVRPETCFRLENDFMYLFKRYEQEDKLRFEEPEYKYLKIHADVFFDDY